MNKTMLLNPFTNVVASGVAICDLNNLLGVSLEAINLTLGGTFTKSNITLIQLKANGKVIFETSGLFLDAIEQFKGYAADPNRLCINFMERSGRTINAFDSGSIDLSPQSGITSLRLEVTTSGAVTPTLYGFAEVSPAVPIAGQEQLRWLMQRHHRIPFTVGAANVKTALPVPHIDPSGGGSVYKRIAFYSAYMTNIQIVRNGVVEFDGLVADYNQMQRRAGRNPQTNLYVHDFVCDNIMSGRVWDTRPSAAVQQAIVYGTFSNTETIYVETEELIPLSMY